MESLPHHGIHYSIRDKPSHFPAKEGRLFAPLPRQRQCAISMNSGRLLSANDFHEPRYVSRLAPMNAQNALGVERTILKQGWWNGGSVASDNRARRDNLLNASDHCLFYIEILRDALDDNLSFPQNRVLFGNRQPCQKPSRV